MSSPCTVALPSVTAAGFIFKLQHFHRLNLQARKVNVKAPAAGGSLNKPLRNIGPAFHRDAFTRLLIFPYRIHLYLKAITRMGEKGGRNRFTDDLTVQPINLCSRRSVRDDQYFAAMKIPAWSA